MPDLIAATRHPRRYLAVGVGCAALHNVIMTATDAAGMNYVPALCLSCAMLVPTAYALHSRYTFERGIAATRFVRFASGQIGGFFINLLLMVLLVTGLGLDVPIATLIATAALFAWNYTATRWAILLHRERWGQPS